RDRPDVSRFRRFDSPDVRVVPAPDFAGGCVSQRLTGPRQMIDQQDIEFSRALYWQRNRNVEGQARRLVEKKPRGGLDVGYRVGELSERHRKPLAPGEGDQPFSPLKRSQEYGSVVDDVAGNGRADRHVKGLARRLAGNDADDAFPGREMRKGPEQLRPVI